MDTETNPIVTARYRGYVLLTDRNGTDIETQYGTTIDHVDGADSHMKARAIIDEWLNAV